MPTTLATASFSAADQIDWDSWLPTPTGSLAKNQTPESLLNPLEDQDISALISTWPMNAGADDNWEASGISTCVPSAVDIGADAVQGADAAIDDGDFDAPSPISSTTTEHDCEAQAIVILHSLQHAEVHSGATSCSTDPMRYTKVNLKPDFDRVLSINRAALNGWGELMKCSCTQCPHLILLYVSVLSKIVFWYRVAGTQEEGSTSVKEANGSSNTGRFANLREAPTLDRFAVRPTDVQVGSLSLDAGDQSDMRRALLLRELRRTELAINDLMSVDRTVADEDGGDVLRRAVEWSVSGLSGVKDELQAVIRKVEQR
jgi:hypothetical protein